MASTTTADAPRSEYLQQLPYCSRETRGVPPLELAAGRPTHTDPEEPLPPCASVPDTIAACVDVAPSAVVDPDSTAVSSPTANSEAGTPPHLATAPSPAVAFSDGGQRRVQASHVEVCSKDVPEEGGEGGGRTTAAVQQMILKQGDVFSRSTSVDSDKSKLNRSISTNSSSEASCAAPSERSNATKNRSNSSGRVETGSTCSNSSPSETSNHCSSGSTVKRSSTRSSNAPRNNYSPSDCSSPASSRGKRYVVVSKSSGSWRQQLQPLRHDIYHVPCSSSSTPISGRAINFVQPKCDAANTVYKIAPFDNISSTSTSTTSITTAYQPVQGPVRAATCSRRPQLEDLHAAQKVSDTAVAAAVSSIAGQGKGVEEALSQGRQNSTGEEATGTTCGPQEKAASSSGVQHSSVTNTKKTFWFTRPFAVSMSSTTENKSVVPSTVPHSTRLPVSVSYPQLTQQGADVEQTGGKEEVMGSKDDDIIRKKSSYLNVSLNSICDELTIISYNIQMLVDCCSLNVNWWSREKQLVQYVRKIAKERNADMVVFQECWSGTSQRLIRSLAKSENGVAFPFQTRVLGADSGPPHYRRAWGDCYCTMAECGRDCCSHAQDEDDHRRHCLCCRACCCCCCFVPLFAGDRSKGNKGVQLQGQQEQQKNEMDNKWTSVTGAFSRVRRNGGVLIISKWPLVERHAYVFKNGALPDCLENKGAVLVRVNKCGRIYNVVGTHLQSGYSNSHVRLAQFRELATWLRSGMEACEQEEFFSAEPDGVSAPPRAPSPEHSAPAADAGKTGDVAAPATPSGKGEGRGATPATAEGCAGTSAAASKKKEKARKKGLPRDLIKPNEPLIICGDLNTRLLEDRDILMEALRADCLNCRLCFPDLEHVPTSYDTVLNSTCAANCRSRKEPVRELLDYFLLSNDHGGCIARWQETITDPVDVPFSFRRFGCVCLPLWSKETVDHCSDHLPVCVSVRFTSGQNE